jgi:RNA polymerase sigma factor (sigma-70 family)
MASGALPNRNSHLHDDSPAAELPLTRYLREIAEIPVLTRAQEQELARDFQRSRAAFHASLSGIPFTAARVVARWTELRALGRPCQGLLALPARNRAAETLPELEEMLGRIDRRLRRHAAAVSRRRASSAAWERFEERLRRDLLSCQLEPGIFDEIDAELCAHLRALHTATAAGDRGAVRRLGTELRLPVPRFRRHMLAVRADRARRDESRNRLAGHNLRLVVTVAKDFRNLGVPFLDLIQEANLGLLRAIELFDPDRGFKFSTYAVWWIRQSLVRAVQRHSRTVRLPSHVNERLHQLRRVTSDLRARLGRNPSPREIGDVLGLPPETVEQLLRSEAPPVSLDKSAHPDIARPLHEVLRDPGAVSPDSSAQASRDHAHLSALLGRLDTREREVIRRRFGFADDERVTLDRLSRELGLSRERVRQIERHALGKLRRWAESAGASHGEDW